MELKSISMEAEDKAQGMTLEELANFVAAAYASIYEAGDTRVKVMINFRGGIKQISTVPPKTK